MQQSHRHANLSTTYREFLMLFLYVVHISSSAWQLHLFKVPSIITNHISVAVPYSTNVILKLIVYVFNMQILHIQACQYWQI